jgi:4-amino-4-deoxy-L-arabinose transferase-like glycosyltransferase
VTEYTARFPSAACAIGSVLITFLIGSYLFNRRVGFWSALALMVTNIFAAQARYVEMESMLTFFIVLSIYCFLRGYREPRRSFIWFILFFAALGLGTLTKGPFAFTFPLIPILGFLFIYKDKKVLSSRPFLIAMSVFLVVLLPWVILISRQYPRFGLVALWETIGRVALGYTHQEPFYFYIEKIGDTLFPWIFFLPFSIWIVFTERLKNWRKENVFLLLWFIGNLLFLSLSKSKRDFYLTPLAPGVSLLIGSSWESVWQWMGEKKRLPARAIQNYIFLTGAALVLISFAAGNPYAINFPGMKFPQMPSLLMFCGLAFMTGASLKRCFPGIAAAPVALYTIVGLILLFQYSYLTNTVPIKNLTESGKTFYSHVSHVVKPAEGLAYYGDNENYTLSFYAGRAILTLKNEPDVYDYMAASDKRYLVLTEKFYRTLALPEWKVNVTGAASEHRSWGGYVLLSNK